MHLEFEKVIFLLVLDKTKETKAFKFKGKLQRFTPLISLSFGNLSPSNLVNLTERRTAEPFIPCSKVTSVKKERAAISPL